MNQRTRQTSVFASLSLFISAIMYLTLFFRAQKSFQIAFTPPMQDWFLLYLSNTQRLETLAIIPSHVTSLTHYFIRTIICNNSDVPFKSFVQQAY